MSSSKSRSQKGTKSTKNAKRTFCAFLWLSSVSRCAGPRAVACCNNRKRRQRLAIFDRRQRRRPMPVHFIQPLELRQLFVGLVLSLQPRVREKELIVHPGIFRIQFNATSQQRHRLFISLQ